MCKFSTWTMFLGRLCKTWDKLQQSDAVSCFQVLWTSVIWPPFISFPHAHHTNLNSSFRLTQSQVDLSSSPLLLPSIAKGYSSPILSSAGRGKWEQMRWQGCLTHCCHFSSGFISANKLYLTELATYSHKPVYVSSNCISQCCNKALVWCSGSTEEPGLTVWIDWLDFSCFDKKQSFVYDNKTSSHGKI